MSSTTTFAADYQTLVLQQDGVEVVVLKDASHKIELTLAPKIGNMAVSAKVNGHEILYLPAPSFSEWKKKPAFGGVPFLAPWANRISGLSYWVGGKKYLLNPDLDNLSLDPNHLPIHGLLAFSSLWDIKEKGSDAHSAHVTSRLEFWKHADLMAQFPFAHSIEITYRLKDGVIEVETVIKNLSADPIPVAIGYHPYFQLDDAPRDEWTAHLAAREHLVLDNKLTPTGEKRRMDLADPFPLKGNKLDDGFTGLVRGPAGTADFWVRGKQQQITVSYGPNYTVAVAFAPPGKSFICFEPMTAVTNAFNLAHEGKFDGLQTVAPGTEWRETFRIQATGFSTNSLRK
jgi:aldose 1-epimerase